MLLSESFWPTNLNKVTNNIKRRIKRTSLWVLSIEHYVEQIVFFDWIFLPILDDLTGDLQVRVEQRMR